MRFVCYVLGCFVIAAFASGCAGLRSPVLPSGSTIPNQTAARGAARGPSWMDAGAAGKYLLYVSNGNGIVNVYRYWQRNLVGELTNFSQPKGQCSDRSGNVYITDYGSYSIVEYAHGATDPIRTIDDSPYRPYACAIDPKTGSLAVANYSEDSSYTQGNVAVYAHARGKPVFYSDKKLYHVNSLAYDRYGDLLATGFFLYSGYYVYTYFAYLPAKSKDFQIIDLPNDSGWYEVQAVGWDGKYWTVDSGYALYQFTINIKPQLIGTVQLEGDVGPVAFYNRNPQKQATQVVGSYGSQSENYVFYWKYPAGGKSYARITHGLYHPYGVAISVAK